MGDGVSIYDGNGNTWDPDAGAWTGGSEPNGIPPGYYPGGDWSNPNLTMPGTSSSFDWGRAFDKLIGAVPTLAGTYRDVETARINAENRAYVANRQWSMDALALQYRYASGQLVGTLRANPMLLIGGAAVLLLLLASGKR